MLGRLPVVKPTYLASRLNPLACETHLPTKPTYLASRLNPLTCETHLPTKPTRLALICGVFTGLYTFKPLLVQHGQKNTTRKTIRVGMKLPMSHTIMLNNKRKANTALPCSFSTVTHDALC